MADTVEDPLAGLPHRRTPATVRRRPRPGDDRRRRLRPARRPLRHEHGRREPGEVRRCCTAGPSPAGRELFTLAAAKHGLTKRDLPPSVSFFKGVRVTAGRRARNSRARRPGQGRRPARRAAAGRPRRQRAAPARPAPGVHPRTAAGARLARAYRRPRRPALDASPERAPRLPEHRRLPGGEGPVMQRTTDSNPRSTRPATRTAPCSTWHGPLTESGAVPGRDRTDERARPAPWSAVVRQGDILTIVDVGGNQSADCLLYNAARHRRALQRAGHDRLAGQRLRRARAPSCARARATRSRRSSPTRSTGRTRSAARAARNPTPCGTAITRCPSTAAGRTSSPRRRSTAWAPATSCPTSTGS